MPSSVADIRASAADVCLVLEGTYPYVSGGVSSWVHEGVADWIATYRAGRVVLLRGGRPRRVLTCPA